MRRLITVLGVVAMGALSSCAAPAGDPQVGALAEVPRIEPILPTIAPVPAADSEARQRNLLKINGAGVVLPDRELTPGAIFDDVTSADICEVHYTQGVRQPRYNTKVAAFAGYGVSIHERDVYKVDHLIPIALGGSNAETNLWPQPYETGGAAGAAGKDRLERHLRGLVCSDVLTLAAAQEAIATDWWAAYQTYMPVPADPGTEGPEPWEPDEPAEGEVVNGGSCELAGEVGYTEPKRVPLTCTELSSGELRWQKRS